MKIIEHNDQVVALIFQHDSSITHGTNFLTPPDLALQVGTLSYKSGESIPAHSHLPVQRTITGTAEFAMIQSGLCEVELYTEQGASISTQTLKAGEAILILSGGHSFRMLDNTVLYLIKQGPYHENEDKTFL